MENNIEAQQKVIDEIASEFKAGFGFLKKYPKTVTMFGSARTQLSDQYYGKAKSIAYRIAKDLDYGIITGGGPGIMEAANQGAAEADGKSLGFTISLPMEQGTNKYVQHQLNFKYFFSRKAMLAFAAEAYIFFPGGFGTFDEFFGVITLIQTGKIPPVPIILVGNEFWTPVETFMKQHMLEKHKAISPDDLNLYTITEDEDKILEIIRRAPVSTWWNVID
jgi:uncharacterized protein (TIGR00730 family)